MALHELYERDIVAWAKQKAGRFAELDIEHLVEEIAALGLSQRQEYESARRTRWIRG